jgi:hypothetical protein
MQGAAQPPRLTNPVAAIAADLLNEPQQLRHGADLAFRNLALDHPQRAIDPRNPPQRIFPPPLNLSPIQRLPHNPPHPRHGQPLRGGDLGMDLALQHGEDAVAAHGADTGGAARARRAGWCGRSWAGLREELARRGDVE